VNKIEQQQQQHQPQQQQQQQPQQQQKQPHRKIVLNDEKSGIAVDKILNTSHNNEAECYAEKKKVSLECFSEPKSGGSHANSPVMSHGDVEASRDSSRNSPCDIEVISISSGSSTASNEE